MRVYINHQERNVENGITLHKLLVSENIPPTGTAIAINNSVIRAAQWTATVLNEEDKIMIIRASKGG